MKWTFLIPTQCRSVTATPKKSFNPFLPPANEVWGKVMFSLACVILFTGERSFASRGSAFWRGLPPGGSDSGGLPPGGSASRGGWQTPLLLKPCPRDSWDTKGYSQQAGGTHPTGMLSCLFTVCYKLSSNCNIKSLQEYRLDETNINLGIGIVLLADFDIIHAKTFVIVWN